MQKPAKDRIINYEHSIVLMFPLFVIKNFELPDSCPLAAQQTFICLKSRIESLEKDVKSAQS